MKIILSLFLLCLSGNALAWDISSGQRFLNPLFYRPMISAETESVQTILTPTSKVVENINGVSSREDCELIENTWYLISLQCGTIVETDRGRFQYDDIYTYWLEKCDEKKEYPYDANWVVNSTQTEPDGKLLDDSIWVIR